RKDARRRRRLELLREQARVDDVVEPEPLAIERAQEAALARKAPDMLVERDREALLMRAEGLDYTEIASALELSIGSVGTTLARRGGRERVDSRRMVPPSQRPRCPHLRRHPRLATR